MFLNTLRNGLAVLLLTCSLGGQEQHKATMAEQKACYQQAVKYSENDFHRAHYRVSRNTCFVEGYVTGKDGRTMWSAYLDDAFEGTRYCVAAQTTKKGKTYVAGRDLEEFDKCADYFLTLP